MSHSYKPQYTLQVIQNSFNLDEFHFLYAEGDDYLSDPSRLLFAAHVLEALYLSEVPFIIIYSDDDEALDIGWGIYLANVETWEDLLERKTFSQMLFNAEADESVNLLESDTLPIMQLYEDINLHLFFIKAGDVPYHRSDAS